MPISEEYKSKIAKEVSSQVVRAVFKDIDSYKKDECVMFENPLGLAYLNQSFKTALFGDIIYAWGEFRLFTKRYEHLFYFVAILGNQAFVFTYWNGKILDIKVKGKNFAPFFDNLKENLKKKEHQLLGKSIANVNLYAHPYFVLNYLLSPLTLKLKKNNSKAVPFYTYHFSGNSNIENIGFNMLIIMRAKGLFLQKRKSKWNLNIYEDRDMKIPPLSFEAKLFLANIMNNPKKLLNGGISYDQLIEEIKVHTGGSNYDGF